MEKGLIDSILYSATLCHILSDKKRTIKQRVHRMIW